MNSSERARSGPRDVFLHLAAVAALYISAVSFGSLLFGYVDYFVPDPLTGAFVTGAMRWAIATLVIIFPAYVWLSYAIARDVAANPEKHELRSRKWLLTFTLFAAAAVILGDLVALVLNFLNGELSARFLLKVAAVLFIAAAVFGYYLWALRTERMAIRDPFMRPFVIGMVLIVVAAIIGGFFVVGSPFAARAQRFDERRVSDLQTIQWQIINFWQRKEALPSAIGELRDDISGFVPPRDPGTDAAYEYRALGPLSFELCAAFETSSADAGRGTAAPVFPGQAPETWAHEAGRVCFTRTIDPEFYPPLSKTLPAR